MKSKIRNLSHGATALLFLCGSYILLGIALASSVKADIDNPCSNYSHGSGLVSSIVGPMFFIEVLYFIALLLWTAALYTAAGLGQAKDEDKFLVSVTYYLSFIPIILALACYIVSGVSPFEIVEALLPQVGISCEGPGESW